MGSRSGTQRPERKFHRFRGMASSSRAWRTAPMGGGRPRIATASADAVLNVWDVTTNQEPLLTLRGHAGSIYGVAFSPDGTQIATGSTDGTVKLWDATSRQEALLLGGHTGDFNAAFN